MLELSIADASAKKTGTEDGFAVLGQVTTLSELSLRNVPVSDLDMLADCPYGHLALQDLEVTDLSVVGTMKNLQSLDVRDMEIDSLDLNQQCPLARVALMDSTLANMAALSHPTLPELDVSGSSLPSKGLLGRLPKLTRLDLSGSTIVDLAPLRTLTRLKELDIANTKVTDLTPLYSLPINKLTVSVGDYVTKDDVRRFEQANPNCDVWIRFR